MEHSDYTWLLELIILNLLIEDVKLHKKEYTLVYVLSCMFSQEGFIISTVGKDE